MAICPTCNSTITDDNPGLLADKVDKAFKGDWDNAESDGTYGWPVGKKFHVAGLGEVEVMAKKAKYDSGDLDSYGELPQGTEFDVWVVLKVGQNYFKKTGEGNSYGTVAWNGPVRPVQPETKTVTVYEFK